MTVCPGCGLIFNEPDPRTEEKPGPTTPQETSRAAAYGNLPRKATQRRTVLLAIARADGISRKEIAHANGLLDSSTDARVGELIQGGWVYDTQHQRDGAFLLALTEKGQNLVPFLLDT